MINLMRIEELLKKDRYQVFLLTCPATLPFSFAAHPWFVVNDTKTVLRYGISWQHTLIRKEYAEGCLYKYGGDLEAGVPVTPIFQDVFPQIWHGRLMGYIEGSEDSPAARMAEVIENSLRTYPYVHAYSVFGPNSNTYAQWVLDHFPEPPLQLPWNAFGKEWGYSGIVTKGSKLARSLGYPTLNIPFTDLHVSGIYAGKTRLKGKEYESALFVNHKRRLLEAHLLGFTGDAYGEKVRMRLVEKIRDDRYFEEEIALKEAIKKDVEKVRNYFTR